MDLTANLPRYTILSRVSFLFEHSRLPSKSRFRSKILITFLGMFWIFHFLVAVIHVTVVFVFYKDFFIFLFASSHKSGKISNFDYIFDFSTFIASIE